MFRAYRTIKTFIDNFGNILKESLKAINSLKAIYSLRDCKGKMKGGIG